MTREVRQPHAGPGWSELAALDRYAAVLDPGDRVGAKNALIDSVHKRALAKALPGLSGLRIIDFGCGTGRLAEWLTSRGAEVNGVDATAEMIQRARPAVPDASFHVIDGFDLPFETGSQDAVISVYVLQYYVVDADAMMALLTEFRRVLRPGGTLAAIEQTTDGDIGRGATVAGYREAFTAAGYEDAFAAPVRLGDSRVTRWVERWPRLRDLEVLPSLVMREAQRTPSAALVGERYADTLFLARALAR
jgi:ubiquinone/menaquinone biosynthesis C-methylase UbiE